MSTKSRFIIKRKDIDVAADDVVLDSDGLTIGRLISNDLVLNHRAVSRTHAGIKQIGGEFWLFNFSESNGTSLNGDLVNKTPLADGDVIQIGPYLLLANYLQSVLMITVERQLQVQTVEGSINLPIAPAGGPADTGATVLIRTPSIPGTKTLTIGGTSREVGTGLLSGTIPKVEEQALEIFWKNRKREAGKIEARTPLHPRGGQKVGKAQFNWKPTLDLRWLWRKSYFYWGALAVVFLSAASYFAYEFAYSPGPVSTSHTLTTLSSRGIAARANARSCSNCHGVTEGMQDKCISCHVTPTFRPTIYAKHDREGIACSSCHTEHQGESIKAGLVSYGLCSNCHNGIYRVKTGENAGSLLPIPHGGTVGYPLENGKWTYKLAENDLKRKGLPLNWVGLEPEQQFHNIHQLGRLAGKVSCGDCHTAGVRGDQRWRATPRAECAKCHGVSEPAAGAAFEQANCNTCHQQHGRSEDVAKFLTEAGTDNRKLKTYLESLERGVEAGQGGRLATAATFTASFKGVGAAEVIRQNKASFTWRDAGGVPWYVWAGLAALLPIAALAVMAAGTIRARSALKRVEQEVRAEPVEPERTGSLDIEKLKAEGPPYPHPVVDPVLCIGCHACVEACPHDVLAIVNGISTPIALDQCMEDTGCTVECPTSPKACIVINSTKPVPKRKVPARDQRLKTNVDGIYMIGDVSGVPLIKNAINEGGQVIDYIEEDLQREGRNGNAQYDVVIIGVGPAGLSAAVIAKQRGLSSVAVEQDKIVSTIANYPAGKYVFFKPDTVQAKGGIPLPGPGEKKEPMLTAWMAAMMNNGVQVQEEESCVAVSREGDLFAVVTEKGKVKEKSKYTARKVILAIGNRGTPMKLRVPGEERKMTVQPPPYTAKHCPSCGFARQGQAKACVKCGKHLPVKTPPPFEDSRVKYKLSDPDDFVAKKCVVVGAGNSAIECAVDLTGFKREGDKSTFTRDNEVTLVIRSDFKGDLKLGNKMNVYDCIDAGRIKVFFRTEIKEITEKEVVLMEVRTKQETARFGNDYVFALIGGEKPTKFLEGLGVKVG